MLFKLFPSGSSFIGKATNFFSLSACFVFLYKVSLINTFSNLKRKIFRKKAVRRTLDRNDRIASIFAEKNSRLYVDMNVVMTL